MLGLMLASLMMADPLLQSVTLYASFDEGLKADHGGGDLTLSTRYDHESVKGQFVFEKGVPPVFRAVAGKGVRGGALEALEALPRRGRIFFPAKGNLAFRKGGWGGAVSFWLNTDPNTMIKSSFCDPVQITEKGAGNGGLWADFPDARPRNFRLGAFPAIPEGQTGISESDPKAPLVVVKEVGFRYGDWHHVVFTWENFDTGRPDGRAALYIDGKLQGTIENRDLRMDWNLEKTGIYIAVGYVGLMDELAVFRRPLAEAEIERLGREPGLLAALKNRL